MNDFERDNAWQREKRDTLLAPYFYGNYAQDGRYVFLDKGRFSTLLQKRYAVDTILQGRDGRAICVEEKIVRWPKSGRPHTSFCLETDSCTRLGYESDGWMHYGQADFLLYCFEQADGSLHAHLIDFPELKHWFWPRAENFHVFGPLKTRNATMGRKVPIAVIANGHTPVSHWFFDVRAPMRSVTTTAHGERSLTTVGCDHSQQGSP